MANFWWVCIAYAGPILLGLFVAGPIITKLYKHINSPPSTRLPVRVLGSVEIVLYITTIALSVPEFIAVWLVIKTAPNWSRRKDEWARAHPDLTGEERQTAITKGSQMWTVSLTGNLLNIILGAIGWLILAASKAAMVFPVVM